MNKELEIFCNAMAEIVLGKRPWISLTQAARVTGRTKWELERIALALNLKTKMQGRRGLVAYRDDEAIAPVVKAPAPKKTKTPKESKPSKKEAKLDAAIQELKAPRAYKFYPKELNQHEFAYQANKVMKLRKARAEARTSL